MFLSKFFCSSDKNLPPLFTFGATGFGINMFLSHDIKFGCALMIISWLSITYKLLAGFEQKTFINSKTKSNCIQTSSFVSFASKSVVLSAYDICCADVDLPETKVVIDPY